MKKASFQSDNVLAGVSWQNRESDSQPRDHVGIPQHKKGVIKGQKVGKMDTQLGEKVANLGSDTL